MIESQISSIKQYYDYESSILRDEDNKSKSEGAVLGRNNNPLDLLSYPLLFTFVESSNPTQNFERGRRISTMAGNAANSTPLKFPSTIPTVKWNSNPRICVLTKPPTPSLSLYQVQSLSLHNNCRFCSSFSLKASSSIASGNGNVNLL